MTSLLIYCGNDMVYSKTYDIIKHCTNNTCSHSFKLQSTRTNSCSSHSLPNIPPFYSNLIVPPIPISSRCVLCLSVCLFCPRIPISTRCVLHLSVCLFRPYLQPLRFVVYLSACFVPVFPSLSVAFCGLSFCLFCPRIPISVRCVLWSIFLLVPSVHPHLQPPSVQCVFLSACFLPASPSIPVGSCCIFLSTCFVPVSPSLALTRCGICLSACFVPASPSLPVAFCQWYICLLTE